MGSNEFIKQLPRPGRFLPFRHSMRWAIFVLLIYFSYEGVVWVALPILPQSNFRLMPLEFQSLGQTSKKGLLPESPYTLVVGDSYGAGQGDWLVENKFNSAKPYQATHVLQSKLGRDVVSFSRPGAGSYDGLAIYAINTNRLLEKKNLRLPPPENLVVYFYEGNDLQDNNTFLQRNYYSRFDRTRIFDDSYFETFSVDIDSTHCRGKVRKIEHYLLFAKSITTFLESAIDKEDIFKKSVDPPGGHRIRAAGKEVILPQGIEGDLRKLERDEIRLGVRVLDRALYRATSYWPEAKRYLVYIPAPLTVYDPVNKELGDSIQQVSVEVRSLVQATAEVRGYIFVDSTATLRAVARTKALHGPRDWNHFNENGYREIANVIARTLQTQLVLN